MMKSNLETADTIVKLVLATAIIIFYFAGVINGPFAVALMILSVIVLAIFAFRLLKGIFLD